MTVAELIEALDGADPTTEVRLMTQQTYPFENALVGIWAPGEDGDGDGEEAFTPASGDQFGYRGAGPATKVLYLVEGRQIGYGTKDAWNR